MKETVFQIFKLGPSFYSIAENGKLDAIYFQQNCLYCIK